MSKWTKATGKVTDKENNPIDQLHRAATQILKNVRDAHQTVYNETPMDISVPIWVIAENGHPYRITIDAGPGVEAEHAIFNAQTRDAK